MNYAGVNGMTRDVERPRLRLSRNPHKQLFWIWMHEAMQRSGRYESGLDIACGTLKTFKYFRTKKYMGIDADKSRVEYALQKYGVQVIHAKIETMPPSAKGDFVVCVQTIGFNTYFDLNNAELAVQKCVEATSVGGECVLNVARLDPMQYGRIMGLLRQSFQTVEERRYALTQLSLPKWASVAIAKVWSKFPALMPTTGEPAWFITCYGRLGTSGVSGVN